MSASGQLLTIGLPVFNGERYVAQAIESILAQTHGDFTLVVSDNASTDATADIVASYAARDDRIVFHRSPANRGAAWNFNAVFEGCATPFFKWAAADDLLAPECVERCLDVITAAPPEAVLAFPWTRFIDADGSPLADYRDPLATEVTVPPHRRLGHVVANVMMGNLVFALMRTQALRQTRLHGGYPSSDYVLLAELALIGAFLEVPEPLFLRRHHAGMSTQANETAEDLLMWFDPEARPVRRESARLLREHFAAIERARLAPADRARSIATLLRVWAMRRWLPPLLDPLRTRLRLRTRIRQFRTRVRRT
jgi:glycosyltransferase involved in cell wall biosynthesis